MSDTRRLITPPPGESIYDQIGSPGMMNETPRLHRFSRDEFIHNRWRYQPGEHVTFLGRTGSGKTTLALELLQRTTNSELPGIVMVSKPGDPTVAKWKKQKDLGYRTVAQWPPPPGWPMKPNGFILWPKHSFDPQEDNPRLREIFRKAILHSYRKGDRILFADELYELSTELNLKTELIAVWSRGRSMGTGLWGASQRPSHIPLWAYSQAEHLFLAHEKDKRARDRFSEIGGVDADLVKDVVMSLGKYEWLYIRTDGPAMCIIEG